MNAETLYSWKLEYGGAPGACAVHFCSEAAVAHLRRVDCLAVNAHLHSFVYCPFAPSVKFFQRRGCPVRGHFKHKLLFLSAYA